MRTLLPLAIFALSTASQAASFDCAKAVRPQERAVCASPELGGLDVRMAALFKRGLAATPAGWKAAVLDDQRAWVRSIAQRCPADAREPAQPMTACLRLTYNDRIKELARLVQHQGNATFVRRTVFLAVPEEHPDAGPASVMPGYSTLAASWPVATGNGPGWKLWNAAVLAGAQNIFANPRDAAKRDWAVQPDNDLTVDVTPGLVTPSLVTAFMDGWTWRGAHPSETSMQLNWLLPEGRELRPEDVFRSGSGWERLLQSRCNAYLHRTLDASGGGAYESYQPKGQMAGTLRGIVTDSRNWKVTQRGIAIVFQDYAVAPRGMHPGPVMIPWAEVKAYLNPAFHRPGNG